MPSLPIAVADAVVAELVAADFAAQRHYRPQFELAELKNLRISVVPRGITITSLGRNLNQHDITVDVAVQKKVDASDTQALDELMNMVQRIADLLRLKRLSAMPAAAWSKTENAPIWSSAHLESKGVFTSVLSITFRVAQ